MGMREELQKRIERKQAELNQLEIQIREANAYIAALQEAVKMLPRESLGATVPTKGAAALRPGTSIYKAYEAIKKKGSPMHIVDLLRAIGRPTDKKNRVSLSGSLASYVRDENVFTRTAPNTFGVIDIANNGKRTTHDSEPPDDFGLEEAGYAVEVEDNVEDSEHEKDDSF